MANSTFSPNEISWLKEAFAAAGVSKGLAAVESIAGASAPLPDTKSNGASAPNDSKQNALPNATDRWNVVARLQSDIRKTHAEIEKQIKSVADSMAKTGHPAAIHAAEGIRKKFMVSVDSKVKFLGDGGCEFLCELLELKASDVDNPKKFDNVIEKAHSYASRYEWHPDNASAPSILDGNPFSSISASQTFKALLNRIARELTKIIETI